MHFRHNEQNTARTWDDNGEVGHFEYLEVLSNGMLHGHQKGRGSSLGTKSQLGKVVRSVGFGLVIRSRSASGCPIY